MDSAAEHSAETVDRRRLLTRAGMVIAGAVGTGLAADAAPAAAAPGGRVVLGANNDAGATRTTITSSGPAATLETANTGVIEVNGQEHAYPSLRLRPNGDFMAASEQGSMGMSTDGDMWYVPRPNGHTYRLHTGYTTDIAVPVEPFRLIDTRSAATRENLLDPSVLDVHGRLIGGQWASITLRRYVSYAGMVYGNAVVVSPTENGWLTVSPWFQGMRGAPPTSNINYVAGQALANAFVCGIGWLEGGADTSLYTDVIAVYSSATTHFILDVMALAVGDPEQILAFSPLSASTMASRADAKPRLRQKPRVSTYTPPTE
ncbi:MAG TPA: hypothetical protein VK453_20255 [Micromonosporaceae bacterium]|nr:hypothetical protein [Micromonosporaceae bacterium]